MKRLFLIAVLAVHTLFLGGQNARQVNLSLRDLMIFKVEGFIATSENWSYQEATELGIYKKTDRYSYTVAGQRYSSTIDYWTWPGEKGSSFFLSNGAGVFYDINNRLELRWTFHPQWVELEIQNKTDLYLLVDLSNIFMSFSREDTQSVTPVGNNLRNIDYDEYDFAFIPPGEKARASFFSLSNDYIIPATVPDGAIIQFMIHWCAFKSNPVDEIFEDITVQEPHTYQQYKSSKRSIYNSPIKVEGLTAYMNLPNNYCENYNTWLSDVLKFETRYHCILKAGGIKGPVVKNEYGFDVFR